jgi:hypothetical protein
MTSSNPDPREIENYLGIRNGSLDHIPHYALQGALHAIQAVREREKEELFRPGLYYIVLSDLCGSTKGSSLLGQDLNIRRVESFILTCIETLSSITPNNYYMPIREIGDAALIIFSSFADVHNWWLTMHEWIAVSNFQWQAELSSKDFRAFLLDAKTVVHVGEVAYSDKSNPIAHAVNQVFKIEKLFKGGELGMTQAAKTAAAPVLRDLGLRARLRESVMLPGDTDKTNTFVVDKWKQKIIER